MYSKKRDNIVQDMLKVNDTEMQRCLCYLSFPMQEKPYVEQEGDAEELDQISAVHKRLDGQIRAQLDSYVAHLFPLSLLLVHVSQLEHPTVSPQSSVLHKRERYHAPASLLAQVLLNVRRVLRRADQFLLPRGAGAAFFLPNVDAEGVYSIVERVYRNVCLLQAETFIPPLRYETEILLGMSSYSATSSSLAPLLDYRSTTTRRLTLRPAITLPWRQAQAQSSGGVEAKERSLYDEQPPDKGSALSHGGIPFLQLPKKIPTRLKQLLPYAHALELCCVPVGRDHQHLTVAMADPSNKKTIHALKELTGMHIFPVSCDLSALNALLASKW